VLALARLRHARLTIRSENHRAEREPRCYVQRLGRPCVVVPLTERAPERAERFGLLACLDAFGDDLEAEGAGEPENRLDECAVVVDPIDERLGDLEHVDREVVQMAQGRIAGAEVVECEPHSELAQLSERLDRRRRILHRAALGDLEDKPIRWGAGVGENRLHVPDEVGASQFTLGQVDADHELVVEPVARAPGLELLAGQAENGAPDGPHETGLLRQRDEVFRQDEAANGVAPPGESLEPHDPAGRQRDDRLVVRLYLLSLDRAFQRPRQLLPALGADVHLGVVPGVAALPVRLRRVHGDVRVAQEVVGDVSLLSAGDADAGVDLHLTPFEYERRATRSSGRSEARTRSATAIKSWSPALWPRLSLMILKSSRSMNNTTGRRCPATVRVNALCTRSAKSSRFANPVRLSWKA